MELHSLSCQKELAVKASVARVEANLADRRSQLGQLEKLVALADCTMESKQVQSNAIQLDDLEPANPKLDDSLAEVQDLNWK